MARYFALHNLLGNTSYSRVVGVLSCFCWLFGTVLLATGSPDLYEEGDDPVMLLIGDDEFGNFGSISSPTTSQLRIKIAEPGEVIYLGLARKYMLNGRPDNFGQYYFQIRRVADGEVVHGPIIVNADLENLKSWSQAAIGPAALAEGGYPTPANYRYEAEEAGDYTLEFGSARTLGLWDITVGHNGTEMPGRLYSQNWAFRVPALTPELPDCVWGGEMRARFYSYTSDGFVTSIDFSDAGFQPLSFTLAFNRMGPGNTGDPQLDRMSIPNENLTGNSAEHLIFIDPPDPELFPNGECGFAIVDDRLSCFGETGYCIPVEVNLPGQLEVVIDLNNNEVYDPATDVLLLRNFREGEALSDCLEWDGLLADGSQPQMGSTVNLITRYTQGVQHWALFDGEFLSEGFCVSSVRPVCGNGDAASLYFDDRLIEEAPGTGGVKDGRGGCDCATPDCRTWSNFDPKIDDCGDIDNDITTGYGDKSTLNTWWFANTETSISLGVPLSLVEVSGPPRHCPGDAVTVAVTWRSPEQVNQVEWVGPDGFRRTGPDLFEAELTMSGNYLITVTDENGCGRSVEYVLGDVSCTINAAIVETICNDNGTSSDPDDDFFTAIISVDGTNSMGWVIPGENMDGTYGNTTELGPFPVVAGEVEITLLDMANPCCSEVLTIPAPLSCSQKCVIQETIIEDNQCDDNGTPLDPSDDLFTFSVTVSGENVSDGWITDEGRSGSFGSSATFGPFSISEGIQTITFSDSVDPGCSVPIVVTPPATCSDQCLFSPEVSNVFCDDAGTPDDPIDDQFYFDLRVISDNATSVAYQIDGLGLYLYGAIQTFGPYLLADGDFMLNIADVVNTDCSQSVLIVAPNSCSDDCGLEINRWQISCDDGGTEASDDDYYYYEILIEGSGNYANQWVASDGTQGDYGSLQRGETRLFAGDSLLLLVADANRSSCSDSVLITVPSVEINCPPALGPAQHPGASITVLGNEIDSDSPTFATEEDLSCWLEEGATGSGEKRYDRIVLSEEGETAGEPTLATFYLFAETGAQTMVGGLFELPGSAGLTCERLSNKGGLSPNNSIENIGPEIPDSLYPSGMVLQQRFTVLLRPDADYSLVTTSWNENTTGQYTWLAVSAEGRKFVVNQPTINEDLIDGVVVNFPWRTYQLNRLIEQLNARDDATINGGTAGCGSPSIRSNDEVGGSCDALRLFRTYFVNDGRDSPTMLCREEVALGHLGLSAVVLPPARYRLECSDTFPQLFNGAPDPAYTGRPAVYDLGRTVPLGETGFAGLTTTFNDTDTILPSGEVLLLRRWTLFDQCLIQEETHDQLIRVPNGEIPAMEVRGERNVCINSSACMAALNYEVELISGAGNFRIQWDIGADGTYEGDSNVDDQVISGSFPFLTTMIELPEGRHRIAFSLTNDCGETIEEKRTVNVFDCYVPSLECLEERVVYLEPLSEAIDIDDDGVMERAAALVVAGDLGLGELTDCEDNLIYSINRVGEEPDRGQGALYLDCEDGFRTELEIYVWDNAYNPFRIQPDGSIGGRNWASCVIEVEIRDPNLICEDCGSGATISLSGQVVTEFGNPMPGVEVYLNQEEDQSITSENGGFYFLAEGGKPYSLTAKKEGDLRLGLSTLDMVLLQDLLLGDMVMNDPLVRVIADVNQDGTINLQDLLLLQGAILGRYEQFSEVGNWRFVPLGWDGVEDIPEELQLGEVIDCTSGLDLMGIKLGDLNRSFDIVDQHPDEVAVGPSVPVFGMDRRVKAGQTVVVPLSFSGPSSFKGGQFSLSWVPQKIEYLEFTSSVFEAAGTEEARTEEGRLLFNSASPLVEETLAQLRFRAKGNGLLSDWVQLCTDCGLSSEVYGSVERSIHPVELRWKSPFAPSEIAAVGFDDPPTATAFPNPFTTQTSLRVMVDDQQIGQLFIRELGGRIRQSADVELQPGWNEVELEAADWPSGVYIYTLELSSSRLSGKLVKR